MNKKINQQRSLFFRNALSFALIFLFLGVIVNQLLMNSLYRNIDEGLLQMGQEEHLAETEIFLTKQNENKLEESAPPRPPGANDPKPFNSFQTEIILWDNRGEIANEEMLGSRISEFSELTVNTDSQDKIETISIQDDYDQTLRFRSLLKETEDADFPYVQYLYNTNQLEDSLIYFQRILIICMLFFWLISLLVSFYLAKWNMRPIIKSWRKQQEFVENSSHELRTPLTIIQTKLEKLFTNPSHTILEESEEIAVALNEVTRLEKLTTALLLLARSDGEEVILDKSLIGASELLHDTVDPFIEIASLAEKELLLKIEGTKEIAIDTDLFKQLMVILLDNALKYTKEQDSITVTAKLSNRFWEIIVEDNGIGFQTDHLDTLFDRFYREDKARQRDTGGHGLGLSIAKWIVELHNGKIEAKPTPNGGACFIVQLPI